ncbi:acyl-CoA dehydrogenase family protein [Ammoniphilus sp. CFH 90114]|uniref:acyl-CoA dehydrogenase family protein n=1 Tax=Ammoniphilus sp. CFH 90114 TaxID=2493665 RepID=UPI00100DB0F4|nr:acyl-CoA dehydrogenase family protein [Ammoniphilus sp. CFH 90114]RXT13671.1 acyl-CoA dehydrogenase [Ammoniphilus sp. CFH 90114]
MMVEKILEDLIDEQLKPIVKKIDAEGFYSREFLVALGKLGFFSSKGFSEKEIVLREIKLVEGIAKVCMTTAFNVWCHLAALTFVRNCDNSYIKNEVLPLLENGERLGGTGLSNAMKYYAGLESLHLKATRLEGGYILSGQLPSVSNLGPDHCFGIIASVHKDQRIMALVPCHSEGLKRKEQQEYLALNGSATFSCLFEDVFIPNEWIIAKHADDYVQKIRSTFVLYQISLGLGVTEASIQCIQKAGNKPGGCNEYLNVQPDELIAELEMLRDQTLALVDDSDSITQWRRVLKARLDMVHLTSKAVHESMLHQGGTAYLQHSDPSRRLRESYFLANLTPTVKHLGKMLKV